MRHIVLFFLLVGTLSINADQKKPQKLQVLSSIKPIHLIVIELVGDSADAHLLIPENSSPHHYSYKPSDITKIKKASLIFRIDEHLESIISPILEKYSTNDKLISLADSKEVHLFPLTSTHSHDHKKGQAMDLHIWTSPENTMAMANSISRHLIEKDRSNAKAYKNNLKQFKHKVLGQIKSARITLLPVKNKPSIIFNDNWEYFRHFFELKPPFVINKQEGQLGNIKTILNVRKKIVNNQVSCVFSDPSINQARVNTITEGKKINTATIFILASNTPIKKGAYFKWFDSITTSIKNCLTVTSHENAIKPN